MQRVGIKAVLLFLLANFVFVLWYPVDDLGRVSLYNWILPGRKRLPYGDNPQMGYNLSLFSIEAMFASHEISARSKPEDEFRVIIIGDSSTWGFLLPVEHALAANLNDLGLKTQDGRKIRAYNLGYPVMSLTKDLVFLSYGMRYEPDMIIWLFTLESFPVDKQLFAPLLLHNPQVVKAIVENYDLDIDIEEVEWVEPRLWKRSIIGGRRGLADWLRLQLYGVMWAATGIDQDIPDDFTPRMENLPPDESFHDLHPPNLMKDDLAFDVLDSGVRMAGDVPILLVNEPMFISRGENSDIRYNFYYPRWVYDEYRNLMSRQSHLNDWNYIDLWNLVPPTEFTNSAIHLSPKGSKIFAEYLSQSILETLEANYTNRK